MTKKMNKRISATLISALSSGVVPRIGLEHIAVGRQDENKALLNDIEVIQEGGSTFRFIVGKYGSGKSFLLQMLRNEAMDRNFVVIDADLSPERRFQGTQNQGLATYKELIRNMSTKTRPDGGALSQVIEKWISNIQMEVVSEQGLEPGTIEFDKEVKKKVYAVACEIEFLVNGFDFAKAIVTYYEAFVEDDDEKKSKVLRWFRGEYTTKSEAKKELGINLIITDQNWYDFIKIYASFVVQIGYNGILMCIDELVNLYKIPTSVARNYNYEKILMMYNDVLQGKAKHLGIVMGGTPECIEDSRTGIFSYEALKSRLKSGKFAGAAGKDLLSPIIRLDPLEMGQVLELLQKLCEIHGIQYGYENRVTEKEITQYIDSEYSRIGAKDRITPRELIRNFIDILNILYQNSEMNMAGVISKKPINTKEASDQFADFEV